MHKIHDTIKEYPTMYRITIYKTPIDFKNISSKKKKQKITISQNDESLSVSVRRTRRTIQDYVHCNDFNLFVTITFSPKKVNRYDLDMCYIKMQSWLERQRRKSRDFRYLIVPEKHKDGAIHFHALVADAPFSMKKTNVIQNNRRVYNITSFRYGFTNAQFVDDDDKQKVANYIAKYITKDMVLISNRKRYWSSRNLRKPLKYQNCLYDIFGLSHKIDESTLVSSTDFNVTYEVPKYLL